MCVKRRERTKRIRGRRETEFWSEHLDFGFKWGSSWNILSCQALGLLGPSWINYSQCMDNISDLYSDMLLDLLFIRMRTLQGFRAVCHKITSFESSWIYSTVILICVDCKTHLLCASLDQVWWKHVSEKRNHTVVKRGCCAVKVRICKHDCSSTQATWSDLRRHQQDWLALSSAVFQTLLWILFLGGWWGRLWYQWKRR